jgi:predicted DNA binding protein
MDKDLDITTLSKSILKQALTQGYFTLPKSSDIHELTTLQLLSLAKSVIKDGLILDTKEEENTNLPSDLFDTYPAINNATLNSITTETVDTEDKLIFLDLDKE